VTFRNLDGSVNPIRVILAVAASAIIMLLTVTSTLALWDRQHIIDSASNIVTMIKEDRKLFKKKCEADSLYRQEMNYRMARLEFLIPLDHKERLKSIERLQKMKP